MTRIGSRPSWAMGDAALLLGARATRSFIFGYLQVILAIYLSQVGFSALQIGVLFAIEIFVTSLLMVLLGFLADRFGRKRILLLSSLFMVFMGIIYTTTTNYFLLLVGAALAGVRGGPVQTAFAPIEQALLAGKVKDRVRTSAFSALSFFGSVLTMLGALLSGLPELLSELYDLQPFEAYRPLFLLILLAGVVHLLLIARISGEDVRERPEGILPRRSSSKMLRLTLSSSLDGLGAGFILPFFSYWFYIRFGVTVASLGIIFAVGEVLNALGLLVGARLAIKMGLINATVLSRIPIILITAILPFSPTFDWARALFLVRFFFASMDVPLVQSYSMAIVDERERASVASVMGMGKRLATALGPGPTGYLFQQALLFLPFIIASIFYIASIGSYYLFFHKLKPPEELEAEVGRKVVKGEGD